MSLKTIVDSETDISYAVHEAKHRVSEELIKKSWKSYYLSSKQHPIMVKKIRYFCHFWQKDLRNSGLGK